MIKMAGSNPTESESAGKRGAHTPMSKQGRPVLRYCAWTSVIPMLRFNLDFRAWAKQRRERPVHANPLGGREVVGAALNKLLRLGICPGEESNFLSIAAVGISNRIGGLSFTSGWAGRRRSSFWELIGANPCTQHGAPALLAKPA